MDSSTLHRPTSRYTTSCLEVVWNLLIYTKSLDELHCQINFIGPS